MSDTFQIRSRFLVIHDRTIDLDAAGVFRDVCMALTSDGADVHVTFAEDDLAAHDLASDAVACQGYDAVLTAGADDVVAGVSLAMVNSGLPMAILPHDGGSLVPGLLGLHGKPLAIADILRAGPDVSLPGGVVNNASFRAFAGFGANVRLLEWFSPQVFPGGRKTKSSAGLAKDMVGRLDRLNVVIDGMNYSCCALFVTRANGFGTTVEKVLATVSSEPFLRVVMIEADDAVALGTLMFAAKTGRLMKQSGVTIRTCRHVEIPVQQDFALEIDGKAIAMDLESQRVSGDLLVLADPDPFHTIVTPELSEFLGSWRMPAADEAA